MSTVEEITHGYLERVSELDPNDATDRGVLGHDAELTDYSPTGAEARAALVERTLAELERAPVEGDRDRLSAAVTRDRLGSELELHRSGDWMRCLNVFGPLAISRRVFDLMPRHSDQDWHTVGERMGKVPRCLTGIRESLELGLERGSISARNQASVCARQARTWAGQNGGPGFFRGLSAQYRGSDPELSSRLSLAAAGADRAYAEFADYLESSYLPRAADRDGCGAELYQVYCRAFNGISLELDETYAWGWDELRRVEEEMAATAELILPGAGLDQVVRLLETDPDRAIEGEERFREWNQEFLDRTIGALNGVHFEIPEPVRQVEAMIAPPGGSPAMYYTAPAQDFSRPGRTWYPTLGRSHFPLWTEISTAFHEGVPGHHLQLGQVCYLGDRISPFQGMLGVVSGHVEGWALYAERLMGELGYLENPDHYLGMLANHSFRAARVVVDIGLHLGLEIPANQEFHPGQPWTRELAVDFMVLKAGRSREFCSGEVDRYLGMPAQAISYKIGERAWLEIREEARRSWGPEFSLRDFHRQALNLGNVGLDQLRQELRSPRPPEPNGG